MPDQSTIALILFGGLAVLILLRVPLGFSLAVAGMAAYKESVPRNPIFSDAHWRPSLRVC